MPKQLKAAEPEDFSKKSRADGDEDDVEGHSSAAKKPRATEDDVEGHSSAAKKPRAAGDEEDTEGHSSKLKAAEPEDFSKKSRADGDEDDTEGHMFLASPSLNQEMARARERDIQRNLKAHATKDEARVHKK